MRFAHSETQISEAQASGGVDSSPKWLLHSETHGSSSSVQAKKWGSGILTEVIVPQLDPLTSSNPAAAALFHKLRLVPLLPGSGGILDLSHELINGQTIRLESLASGFHI